MGKRCSSRDGTGDPRNGGENGETSKSKNRAYESELARRGGLVRFSASDP